VAVHRSFVSTAFRTSRNGTTQSADRLQEALDGTFGPERVFVKVPAASNVSPAEGYQFFRCSARSISTGIRAS
jgi:hypothetical protein